MARRGNAMRLHGIDAELLDREQLRAMLPMIGDGQRACSRSSAGCCSRAAARRGTMRWPGDSPAAADRRGVDIIETLRGDRRPPRGRPGDRRRDHARLHRRGQGGPRGRRQHLAARRHGGPHAADRDAMCCRRSCRRRSSPISTASRPSGPAHFYISQSDKGGLVFGGDLDGYNSYSQRGNLPLVEHLMGAASR